MSNDDIAAFEEAVRDARAQVADFRRSADDLERELDTIEQEIRAHTAV